MMPKRKYSASLLDQELKFQLEDMVGTQHLSEIEPGDELSAQIGIEDLRMDKPRASDVDDLGSGSVSPKHVNDEDAETYFQDYWQSTTERDRSRTDSEAVGSIC